MAVMLQKYDRVKTTSLLALAAVGGFVFAPAAQADGSCNMSNGLDSGLVPYVAEAEACLTGQSADYRVLEADLYEALNARRVEEGKSALQRRASLDAAAQVHAMDMATRSYVAHEDLEGRDHLYRVRAFDRSVLIGASGANVLSSDIEANAGDILFAMRTDPQNAKNLTRDGFTDVGIGVAEANGRLYTVQVFATVEGKLADPLPLSLVSAARVRPRLADRDFDTLGWGVAEVGDENWRTTSSTSRIRPRQLDGLQDGALSVVVSERNKAYILKGPLVTAN